MRAMVTGVSRGIGRAICLQLAKDSMARGEETHIVACGTGKSQDVHNVVAELQAMGVKAQVVLGDLTDAEAPARMVDEALQFAGGRLITALVSFNLGVELGQLAIIVLLVPLVGLLFRWVEERKGVIVVSALVAHTALHWLTDRAELLGRYEVNWTAVALWTALAASALAAVWLGLAKARRPAAGLAPDSQT